ncbi:MAG: ABC transporter ATP-binding protein [Phycisphaerae bacterium]|nr:ABC transporter ATP-binding protein [Phycisphaerae bacterium]
MLILQDLAKTYRTRAGEVKALDGVSLRIDQGEFIAVCGPSGSGKTTLLMMIAAMLRPSRGTVQFEDRDLYQMTGAARAKFRARNIGFVFQMFHLVPYLNVLENVLLAGAVARSGDGRARAEESLQRLGLGHRIGHRPSELSAGEKQRTAIARALLNRPKLILADEPTGNLDSQNAEGVLRHLQSFQRDGGTIIMATHGLAAQGFATRTIDLREGRLA